MNDKQLQTHDTISPAFKSPPIWPIPGVADYNVDSALLTKIQREPLYFFKDFLGTGRIWDDQKDYGDQRKLIEAVAKHKKVVVPSGHSLGKDWCSARLMLWFLYSFMPSIVIATAATDRQISKIIWGELAEAFHGANRTFRGRFLTKEIIVDDKMKWYAIGFATRDVHKTPGKFQGFHQKSVFILFSEAQAIEKSIWEQAESLMTGENVRWVAIGNPIVNYGAFHEACQPGSGWEVVRLDCENSPNVKTGDQLIPGMCSKSWVDDMAVKHGKTHPTYISKVKGITPPKSVDAFIEGGWIEWANTVGLEIIPIGHEVIAGVDIAAMGKDKTVITVREGMRVVDVKKSEKQSTMVTAGQVVGIINNGASKVFLDVTGVGTGVYDRLVELGFKNKVVPINFGAKPMDNPFEIGPLKNSDKYADMGTQIYATLATLLEKHFTAIPYDEDLNTQLTNRRMKTLSNGKMKLEPKEQFEARGFSSPDESDSMALCFMDAQGLALPSDPYVHVEEEDTGIEGIFNV